MNIEELLNKYFEGETSSEEEQQLRTYFSSGEVPEHLIVYKPLFAYIEEEIKSSGKNSPDVSAYKNKEYFIWYQVLLQAILLIMD